MFYIIALAIWILIGVFMLNQSIKTNQIHQDKHPAVLVIIYIVSVFILPLFLISFLMEQKNNKQAA